MSKKFESQLWEVLENFINKNTKYKCGISTAPLTPVVTSGALHNSQSIRSGCEKKSFQQFFECLRARLCLQNPLQRIPCRWSCKREGSLVSFVGLCSVGCLLIEGLDEMTGQLFLSPVTRTRSERQEGWAGPGIQLIHQNKEFIRYPARYYYYVYPHPVVQTKSKQAKHMKRKATQHMSRSICNNTLN